MAWQQLVAMVQEAREIEAQDRSGVPSSCVQCYTALREGPEGTLFCPWDGLRWPEDASAWGEFPGSF